MKWLKYLQAGAYCVGWITKASADGQITVDELVQLVKGILEILELPPIEIQA